MTGHVIWAFVGVGEVGIVLRHEPIEVVLEVSACRGICVFHENKAAACVLAEDGGYSILDFALSNRVSKLVCDFEGALSSCSNF